ncbi:hypothetical protein NIGALANA_3 [Bacillus phage Nigalana]|nr:hypothetical protein BI005_gp003 [Bacillus phage Nigalana]AMW61447.1 hypothetical protein NIGALANA_3 [Bacillus phage Nigalana]
MGIVDDNITYYGVLIFLWLIVLLFAGGLIAHVYDSI